MKRYPDNNDISYYKSDKKIKSNLFIHFGNTQLFPNFHQETDLDFFKFDPLTQTLTLTLYENNIIQEFNNHVGYLAKEWYERQCDVNCLMKQINDYDKDNTHNNETNFERCRLQEIISLHNIELCKIESYLRNNVTNQTITVLQNTYEYKITNVTPGIIINFPDLYNSICISNGKLYPFQKADFEHLSFGDRKGHHITQTFKNELKYTMPNNVNNIIGIQLFINMVKSSNDINTSLVHNKYLVPDLISLKHLNHFCKQWKCSDLIFALSHLEMISPTPNQINNWPYILAELSSWNNDNNNANIWMANKLVHVDEQTSMSYMRKAAENGNKSAKRFLGTYFSFKMNNNKRTYPSSLQTQQLNSNKRRMEII